MLRQLLTIAVWTAVIAIILTGLLALAARSGNRLWSDKSYEREKDAGTALGNALLITQSFVSPGAQHALEQRTIEEADQEESGAPPDPDERLVTELRLRLG